MIAAHGTVAYRLDVFVESEEHIDVLLAEVCGDLSDVYTEVASIVAADRAKRVNPFVKDFRLELFEIVVVQFDNFRVDTAEKALQAIDVPYFL